MRLDGWAASWRRAQRRIGHRVGLVVLVAGLLPAWPIGGAMSAHVLPAAKAREEAVIVEVAPGANPDAVARALGVMPTHVYTEVFQGFAAELPAGALKAARDKRGVV